MRAFGQACERSWLIASMFEATTACGVSEPCGSTHPLAVVPRNAEVWECGLSRSRGVPWFVPRGTLGRCRGKAVATRWCVFRFLAMPSISSTHQCSGKMSGGMEIESGGAGHVSRSAGRADVETTTTKGLTGFMPNRKVGRPGLCLRDTSRSPLFLAKHGATAASASRERRAAGGRTAGE